MNKEDLILEKLNSIENSVSGLKTDVSELKTDVSELKSDVAGLKSDVRRIDMTIENRIWPAIQTIAEAHLDTQRYVKSVCVDRSEIDLINNRLNRLEAKIGV